MVAYDAGGAVVVHQRADWKDADLLPAPKSWAGGLPEGRLPAETIGIDASTGRLFDVQSVNITAANGGLPDLAATIELNTFVYTGITTIFKLVLGLALALLRLDELEAAKASPTTALTAGEVRLSLPDSEQR